MVTKPGFIFIIFFQTTPPTQLEHITIYTRKNCPRIHNGKTGKLFDKILQDQECLIIIIEDITRWCEDMNFIFEWQNNILRTGAASE